MQLPLTGQRGGLCGAASHLPADFAGSHLLSSPLTHFCANLKLKLLEVLTQPRACCLQICQHDNCSSSALNCFLLALDLQLCQHDFLLPNGHRVGSGSCARVRAFRDSFVMSDIPLCFLELHLELRQLSHHSTTLLNSQHLLRRSNATINRSQGILSNFELYQVLAHGTVRSSASLGLQPCSTLTLATGLEVCVVDATRHHFLHQDILRSHNSRLSALRCISVCALLLCRQLHRVFDTLSVLFLFIATTGRAWLERLRTIRHSSGRLITALRAVRLVARNDLRRRTDCDGRTLHLCSAVPLALQIWHRDIGKHARSRLDDILVDHISSSIQSSLQPKIW